MRTVRAKLVALGMALSLLAAGPAHAAECTTHLRPQDVYENVPWFKRITTSWVDQPYVSGYQDTRLSWRQVPLQLKYAFKHTNHYKQVGGTARTTQFCNYPANYHWLVKSPTENGIHHQPYLDFIYSVGRTDFAWSVTGNYLPICGHHANITVSGKAYFYDRNAPGTIDGHLNSTTLGTREHIQEPVWTPGVYPTPPGTEVYSTRRVLVTNPPSYSSSPCGPRETSCWNESYSRFVRTDMIPTQICVEPT